jgi:two-component system sensor histidine kinase PfeS
VAGENETDIEALRQRLDRELQTMERLVADTLELVWLDTERPRLPLEPVEVGRLWEVLREDACFESGWSEERLPCDLEDDCLVRGHLNGLAQALENILRNAIRHSPEDGVVRLSGCRDGQYWHLWIDDQGPGVDDQALESIFQPFTRLNAARPGGDGFGLGLSIARSMVRLQGGELWAENLSPGLRMNIRLHAV